MAVKYCITMGGDTSLGDYYLRKRNKELIFQRLLDDPASFFEGVKPIVEGSDYFILNLETVLAENPQIILESKEYPNYDTPDRILGVLNGLGVTAVNLANNHSMDYGSEILLNSIQHLHEAGIDIFGAGANLHEASQPLRIQLQGHDTIKTIYIFAGLRASKRYREQFAFFAEQEKPGVYPFSIQTIKNSITDLRSREPGAIIIVCPHWQGYDYKWVSPRMAEISRDLIDAGANYVLAHGTHMVNQLEKRDKGIIAHSIGNFIFNSPGRYKKLNAPPYSFIVRLEIEESEGNWNIEERFYPIVSDNRMTGFRSYPIDENGVEELQQVIRDKSGEQFESTLAIKKDNRGFYFVFDRQQSENSMNNTIIKSDYDIFKPLIGKVPNTYTAGRFSTNKLLSEEFARLGYESRTMDKYLIVDTGDRKLCFLETESSNTSLLGWRILKNKYFLREFLIEAGVSVAQGKLFQHYQKEEAEAFALSFKACVIKPADGRKGMGITVGVSDKKDFAEAWNSAVAVTNKGILIEEQFTGGVEARYLVVGNKCAAVVQRIPPNVIGNGIDTVEMLIKNKNDTRKKNPNLMNKLIELDQHRISVIQNQGFQLDGIPGKDEVVLIDWKANLSTGADSCDITDEVHPLFKEVAERISLIIPGLDIIGVDILAHDHTQEPDSSNYIIVEANTRPGIGGHHYPAYGKPRNVGRLIAENSLGLVGK